MLSLRTVGVLLVCALGLMACSSGSDEAKAGVTAQGFGTGGTDGCGAGSGSGAGGGAGGGGGGATTPSPASSGSSSPAEVVSSPPPPQVPAACLACAANEFCNWGCCSM